MPNTLEIVLIFLAASWQSSRWRASCNCRRSSDTCSQCVLIGPHAIGLVPDAGGTRYLAEFGVVFLMFSIGLEFNLPRLMALRATVFGFGFAQVLVTTLLGVAAALAMGLGWQAGVALGGALAMSSTAIVIKLLSERWNFRRPSRTGRDGILLFQDLALRRFL